MKRGTLRISHAPHSMGVPTGDHRAVDIMYIERAPMTLQKASMPPQEMMIRFFSPLGSRHINLTEAYVRRQSMNV